MHALKEGDLELTRAYRVASIGKYYRKTVSLCNAALNSLRAWF